VVIGASAGGVEVLTRVVSGLPADLPASICVVMHIAPTSPSALAAILDRSGPLECRQASDGEALVPGVIFVASPDRHLAISDEHVSVTSGPQENGHRPAVDVLFRTAARAKRHRVIGVVLSGAQDDGTAGLALIKACGGTAIVQDPAEAMYAGMPGSAVTHVSVDTVAPSSQIAKSIVQAVRDAPPQHLSGAGVSSHIALPGDPVTSICPECGGVLTEHRDAGMTQWRCRVGHRYSPHSLADAQADDVEAALWAAVRALADRHMLLDRLAAQLESRNQERSARSFRQRAAEAAEQAEIVRRALVNAASGSLRRVADDDQAEPAVEEVA
jgi:two-component system, chemotaxis family, protein-glutamate methylesterase/glutaminase